MQFNRFLSSFSTNICIYIICLHNCWFEIIKHLHFAVALFSLFSFSFRSMKEIKNPSREYECKNVLFLSLSICSYFNCMYYIIYYYNYCSEKITETVSLVTKRFIIVSHYKQITMPETENEINWKKKKKNYEKMENRETNEIFHCFPFSYFQHMHRNVLDACLFLIIVIIFNEFYSE